MAPVDVPPPLFLAASILGPASWLTLTGCNGRATTGAPDAFLGRTAERERMVAEQIAARGVRDERLLDAMREIPRELFVPAAYASDAYADHPLPIGHEQTISQPYIVAYMTELLELDGDERVLEIGTGSGYQAAVLGELVAEVYSIEIVAPLAERAGELLARLGYDNVHVRSGDGYRGWPSKAPFDRILLTAAPEEVPEPLLEQLAVGGRLVAPVGRRGQELVLIRRTEEGYTREELLAVRFVPMTGEAERAR